MGLISKAIILIVCTPIVIIVFYLFFLWFTYIDESVKSGEAYGVSIGSTKRQSYVDILQQFSSYNDLSVYIDYGPKAGENFTIAAAPNAFDEIEKYDDWTLLLDGEGKFFNTIKLKFKSGRLVYIHRHRKKFELP